MPGLVSHYTFLSEILKGREELFPSALFLGAQGADPFYYYSSPFRKKRAETSEIRAFAGKVHHRDFARLYLAMLDYAKHSGSQLLLYSYLKGLLSHYVLDRFSHPFVISRSGYAASGEDPKPYIFHHVLFETMLDLGVGDYFSTRKERVLDYVYFDPSDADKISKMWYEASILAYEDSPLEEKSFTFALIDFLSALRYSNSPRSLSYLRTVLFSGPHSVASALHYPRKVPTKYQNIDFLNAAHGAWREPVTGVESTSSFLDLFLKAEPFFLRGEDIVGRFIEGGEIKDAFFSFVDNRDHDGEIYSSKKSFSSPVW